MSDQSATPAVDLKAQLDTYKLRVDELDRNYFSHRDLEWKITLQFLTGYVAIGAGYFALRKDGPNEFLSIWCLVILGLLFLVYLFFSYLHRQRLTWTRELKNEYVAEAHKLTGASHLEKDRPYTPQLPHWYAFAAQIAVHLIAVVSAAAYIVKTMR